MLGARESSFTEKDTRVKEFLKDAKGARAHDAAAAAKKLRLKRRPSAEAAAHSITNKNKTTL
jgi:hypothetical protein